MTDKPDRQQAMVCLPALRAGNVGLVVATQIARCHTPGSPWPGWNSPHQAWAHTQAQLAWYREMELEGEMYQVHDLASLEKHLELWQGAEVTACKPVGYILSLEGADSIVNPDYLEKAHGYGLRAVGLSHYGPGRYANGTDAFGRLPQQGLDLLKKMESLHLILDASHLCDDAFWQAINFYQGPIWASHNNCRALVNHNRQFSDEQILALIEHDAVIGCAMDAWMIVQDWIRGKSIARQMHCDLAKWAAHVRHICALAGDSLHVGIGSDLDGGFGREQSPFDLDSISDVQRIISVLNTAGFNLTDIENIMHGNWLRFLRKAWQK